MLRYVLPAVAMLALGAGLGQMAAAPASAQSSTEAAETTLWDSIKFSKNPDEIRAYLDKYPNGLYVALARIRLKNLEAAGGSPASSSGPPQQQPSSPAIQQPPSAPPQQRTATPPLQPPPPQPSSTASVLTSPAVIREVQDRLYSLNYEVGVRNGRLTAQMREAIFQWQDNTEQPGSGDITEAQLAMLRRAAIPTTWGALAYYTKGAAATVWNRPTREIAEKDALAECRKNARATCSVLTVANTMCGALGFYNAVVGGRQHWGAYASVRPTLGQATDNALSECRRQAKQSTACGVRTTVCADGGHRR